MATNNISLGANLVGYLIAAGWRPPQPPSGKEWRELEGRAPSWYLVDLATDEILAWVNKRSENGATFIYNDRYFVSLHGAQRAAEHATDPANQVFGGVR